MSWHHRAHHRAQFGWALITAGCITLLIAWMAFMVLQLAGIGEAISGALS